MPKLPNLISVGKLIETLDRNPFGALILLLLCLAIAAIVWMARH